MSSYKGAFDYALKELRGCDPEVVVRNSLVEYQSENRQYIVSFFKRPHVVSLEDGEVYERDSGRRCSLGTGMMIMHYLSFAQDKFPTERLITLKEVPGGEIFFPAFQKAVITPLARTFEHDLAGFARCATTLLGGEELKMGHAAAKFEAFPKVPLVVVIWEGDEEISGSANFLYDSSVEYFSPTETIIGYGYFVAEKLVNYYQKGENNPFWD